MKSSENGLKAFE